MDPAHAHRADPSLHRYELVGGAYSAVFEARPVPAARQAGEADRAVAWNGGGTITGRGSTQRFRFETLTYRAGEDGSLATAVDELVELALTTVTNPVWGPDAVRGVSADARLDALSQYFRRQGSVEPSLSANAILDRPDSIPLADMRFPDLYVQ